MELFHPTAITRVDIAFCAQRHVKIIIFVAAVRCRFANVPPTPEPRKLAPVIPRRWHLRPKPPTSSSAAARSDYSSATLRNRQFRREKSRNWRTAGSNSSAHRAQTRSEIADHHPPPGHHFKHIEQIFAFAETVEEHRHRRQPSACVPNHTK